MPDPILALLSEGVTVFDLGRPMFNGMPQSPNSPPYRMVLQRRHGDYLRDDGGSAASELIVTGGHVGTHIDALAHVSHQGKLHGHLDAADAQKGGAFSVLGIDTVEPMFCRGVLLDIPRALGLDVCEPGYEITPGDLETSCQSRGIEITSGDVILIHTGWGRRWDDPESFLGLASGVPGPGEQGAQWLASHRIRAAGSDTIAFERIPPGRGHALLPAHRVLLVEHGVHIIENLYLEELAVSGAEEFLFVLAPLKLAGATGSPVRPLAVVGPR